MGKTYEIRTLADMFAIPVSRHAAFVRDLEYFLGLSALAFGEGPAPEGDLVLTWTDDGKHDVSLQNEHGVPWLELRTEDSRADSTGGG